MANQFYQLKVVALNKPIEDATTITFDIPNLLRETFQYQSGQHLIIKFHINGEEVRRSYSLNSCPFKDEQLQVTVKRVTDGLVSNFVNDKLKIGDELEVMNPQGRFFVNVQQDAYKTYFLFAAGSGITPIISILKSVLYASPYSVVNLFYGNRNQDTIIFKNELDNLQQEFSKRLKVVHTLSQPKTWTTWEPARMTRSGGQWKGKKGRIDTAAVEQFIAENPPIAQTTEYYICAPSTMNVSIKKALMGLGVPKELIHIEQFGGSKKELDNNINAIDNAQLTAVLYGKEYNLNIPKGKTILQVLKEAKTEPPYSCESGVCGTCIAKIKKGKAEMKSCMALEDNEIDKGLVLTCQAIPTTKEIEIVF